MGTTISADHARAVGRVYGGAAGSAGHRDCAGGDAVNCQHEIPYEDRAGHLKSKSCPKNGGKDGWCPDHAHSRELLAKGARLGYPAIDELHLSAGRRSWEAYAECFPRTVTIKKNWMPHIINRYDQVIGILDAKLQDALNASNIAPESRDSA